MSRSDYSEGCWGWDLIRWRGAVKSAIRGKKGQAFLKDLLAALDALPVKRLIAHELVSSTGEVCAIGSVMIQRGIDATELDPEDSKSVAKTMNIAAALAREIVYVNDEKFDSYWDKITPERRFERVREWVAENIAQEAAI